MSLLSCLSKDQAFQIDNQLTDTENKDNQILSSVTYVFGQCLFNLRNKLKDRMFKGCTNYSKFFNMKILLKALNR